ncbi:MAG: hypothetical protein ISS28_01490 [Candidatus Cloacimonetes bacterium]|nr:hypothetical protein [Candidatus Cloacimonadota bacterium]MBL7085760.1 hypothetical protein [Candidatus Cloacimonadota bacterium]
MGRKKKTKEKYIYDAELFCVPVTKISPLENIQFVIDEFIRKKITFCVDGSGDRWEVWRIEEKGDSDKIKKKDYPRKPKFLYVKGKKIDYEVK